MSCDNLIIKWFHQHHKIDIEHVVYSIETNEQHVDLKTRDMFEIGSGEFEQWTNTIKK